MADTTVNVNRAPVLTLWAAVVAERLGFDTDTALTLGKVLAGLNAQSKGRSIGIFQPPKLEGGRPPRKAGLGEEFWIDLCGRAVPARRTADGVRAVVKDQPVKPDAVRAYLEKAFGADLAAITWAMMKLAAAFEPDELAMEAFRLYEKFRPEVSRGKAGWGQKGVLDTEVIMSLAQGRR